MRVGALVLVSAIALASPAIAAQTIQQKVRAWYVWNKHCHDSSKDSAMRDKSCEFRDDVGRDLDKAGWCNFTKGDKAQKPRWHKCGSESLYTPE